jgi:uncharacterized protein YdaU (DUF1376 family)
MHLTLLEHGAYRQLIDLYYLNECELNANAMRLVCARNADEVQAVESVLNEFFVKTDKGYKHKRCEAEIAKYKNKSIKASASANARWTANNANAMRRQCEGNANHKPITNNHKPYIKGLRLPNDWVAPQEYIDFCNTERPDLDANKIALMFKDYWISISGSKAIKTDWLATWRNWVRRQEKNKSSYKNKSDVISDVYFDGWLNSDEKAENGKLK